MATEIDKVDNEDEELVVLDISKLNFESSPKRVEKLVEQLSKACEGPGFFLLKVSDDFGQLCVNMLECAKEIFPLPPDEKARLINDHTSQMHYLGDIILLLRMTNKIWHSGPNLYILRHFETKNL